MVKKIKFDFKLGEKPKTKEAWWALMLGLCAIFAAPFLIVLIRLWLRSEMDPAIVSVPLSVAAIVVSVHSYKKGERSWIWWSGLVSGVLVAVLWTIMIAAPYL